MKWIKCEKTAGTCLATSAGLLGLAQACAAGCAFLVWPLTFFFSSLGFGTAAIYLPKLQLFFLASSIVLASFSIGSLLKARLIAGKSMCPCFCQRYLRKVLRLEK